MLSAHFEVVAGTPGLGLADVAHILVPGRGRDRSGFGLNGDAYDRISTAYSLYKLTTLPKGGRIVCSGYKSPSDHKGVSWSPPESPNEVFCGMPEADIMRRELVQLGVRAGDIEVERHSIDTVGNFLRSELEGHFGDDRPVAIVAQRAHLDRILRIIAPRTLRRDYLGVIVGDSSGDDESMLASAVSNCVLAGLPTSSDESISRAERRVQMFWQLAHLFGLRTYY